MLYTEIIHVYCENHTKRINTPCGQNEEFTYVLGCHSDRYEEFYLPGYNAAYSVESRQTFGRHMSPPFSRSNDKPSIKAARVGWQAKFCLQLAGILLGLFFGPEEGGNMFLRNVVGNRICDLPACSTVPQSTTLRRAMSRQKKKYIPMLN
jgi:hypothetical protein